MDAAGWTGPEAFARQGNAGWIAEWLGQPATRDDAAGLVDQLRGVPLPELLTALETAPDQPGPGAVVQLYEAWIATNPGGGGHMVVAWFNLGAAAARDGDLPRARQAYMAALALRPEFHPAAINLGLMQEAAGQPAAALATWAQALQPASGRTALLNHRARLLEQAGQLDEAERLLWASLATDPAQPDAIQHWVHLRQRMCRWPVLASNIPGLSQAELIADCGPLGALSLTDRVAGQTAITARWVARKTVPAPRRLSPARGYQHEKVRLGYMSSDFGRHAMAYLIAELFEQHDRTRFTVYGYCIGQDDGSDVRARLVRSFDRFTSLQGLSDEEAAQAIAADEIDILVDLNGLTRGARPQILRWKPAPVQATYLGFVGPVPLPELDHLFCDDFVAPSAVAPLYRPAPLPVAAVYQANDSRRIVGKPTSRAANGLPDDAFVFCCFSNHYKVTQELFTAWMAILVGVPGSILWLAVDNEWSSRSMVAEAARVGIDPARLVFADRIDPASYIQRLSVADLFLDTFPYNAGTIASDALRMGLPLLTLSGEAFASRMAARLLSAIGADEGITTTLASYVETAIALATQPRRYAQFKARFTETAWRDTIGNIGRFTREFEATLLKLRPRALS